MLISKFVTETSVFALSDSGKTYSARSDHPNYSQIVEAVEEGREEELEALLFIRIDCNGLKIEEGRVFIDGERVESDLEGVLLARLEKKRPLENLVAFYRRLQTNPSFRIRKELFRFIYSSESIGITDDGFITAFKIVKKDEKGFVSEYDGKTRHDIGTEVSMDRRLVDDDPRNTCSKGLHACSEGYLDHYGQSASWVIVVKIDPADVVCIPLDHGHTKMRCCRYEVLKCLGERNKVAYAPPQLEYFEEPEDGIEYDDEDLWDEEN